MGLLCNSRLDITAFKRRKLHYLYHFANASYTARDNKITQSFQRKNMCPNILYYDIGFKIITFQPALHVARNAIRLLFGSIWNRKKTHFVACTL